MGRVLLARDPVLGRHVAVKLLRDDLAIAADVRDALIVRMRHEARAAARVTHPNLVVIHDMGEDDVLGLYLVFEYIEGPTLKQRLTEGRLSARQAARIAREIGAALTFAHERGVLHRDVKPENIILSPTGAKLTDFGIARVPDSTLTHAGGLLGTPAYSAPETFRDGRFSPESDQFSLATTMYEAIRGSRAFPGDDALSVASKIMNDEPEAFAESLRYPSELDAILARGMARDPTARFESCKILGTKVMDALLSRSSISAPSPDAADAQSTESIMPPARLSTTFGAPPDRRGWKFLAAGLGALAVIGLLTRMVLRSDAQSPVASAATQDPSAPTAEAEAEVDTSAGLPSAIATAKPPRKPPRSHSASSTASSAPAPTPSASISASTKPSASTSAPHPHPSTTPSAAPSSASASSPTK